MQTYTIDIRPRRQATLPRELLKEVGIDVGDKLVAEIKNKQIILKPRKQFFLDTLAEIQRIVKASGVPEAELQDTAQQDRKKWAAQKYGPKNLS